MFVTSLARASIAAFFSGKYRWWSF